MIGARGPEAGGRESAVRGPRCPYLLLDTDLRIVAANTAYLRATRRHRDELTGAYMFDAFPDNPADTAATGVANLTSSFERVLRRGAVHEMGVQRYDIATADAPDRFAARTWVPVNSPLTDAEGQVVGVLHHVEDVTAVEDSLVLPAGPTSPAPLAPREAVLLAVRYRRALTEAEIELAGVRADAARRDRLWHRIAHAARDAGPGGCATAICAAATRELPGIEVVFTVYGANLAPTSSRPTAPGPATSKSCN